MGRSWATARPPPHGPGRGGGRPPGIARPRGASEARIGRGQRAALSISPAGGLGTDARRARGSGGGHRSTATRTRARPEPSRDPLPAPAAAEFPDSLIQYILDLFGRTDPQPQEPETAQAVDRDRRLQVNASDAGPQRDTGGPVAERRNREDNDGGEMISAPELLSPRPRSNAMIWFNEPLADGAAQHAAEANVPDTDVSNNDNESQNPTVSQLSLIHI